jgi:hypothetical protein
MSRSDAEDANLRWQAFLIDGFEGWLPAATVASAQMLKTTPRDVLKGMIADFYYPDGIQQTTDDISNWIDGYAMRTNAWVRDPVTGERIGRMQDLENERKGKAKRPAKPVHDPVRAKRLAKRQQKKTA